MTTDLSSISTPFSTLPAPATSILSFSEGSAETIKPSPCTAPCGVAAYHAAGIGPTPELCDRDETAFISAYENCKACIENHEESADGVLKPELQQALEYCHIEMDFDFDKGDDGDDNGDDGDDDNDDVDSQSTTASDGPSLSAEESSADESSAEETSSPTSGSADNSESGDDNGDDDSSGSHLSSFGPVLGSIAGLLHFIFI